MGRYAYLHLDVFTDAPFSGNPLAVLPEAAGLDTQAMQRIAREFNFSETTFVLAPEVEGTDARVRIFTPEQEIPIAGHPTVGTAFALAHTGRIGTGCPQVTFGLGVGPTPVRLEWNGAALAFAWMTQPVPRFQRVHGDTAALAAALGLDADAIEDTGLPLERGDNGVVFLYLAVKSRAAVDAVQLNRAAYAAYCRAAGVEELSLVVFSLEAGDDDAHAWVRMFAPAFGVPEDPATGSAAGPLGAYLVRHDAAPANGSMVFRQGVRMGRPSRIAVEIRGDASAIERVDVGGTAVLVAEGTIRSS